MGTGFVKKGLTGVLVFLALTGAAVAGVPPENGVQKIYYSGGELHIQNVFKHGVLTRQRIYYRDGQLSLEKEYDDGVLVATRSFYDNGNRRSRWFRRTGTAEFYDRNGKLRTTVSLASPEPD